LEAADFWAWRKQVFDFSLPVELPVRPEISWAMVNLDSPAKRQRIAEITTFLHAQPDTDSLSHADLQHELGRLYWSIGEYTLARQHLDIAINAYTLLDDAQARAMSLRDLARILDAQEAALRLLRKKVLPVFSQLRNENEIAITHGKIADILQARGQLDQALQIRKTEELPVYEKLGEVRLLLVGRTNLALLLWQMDAQNNAAQVQVLLCQALTEARWLRLPEAERIEEALKHRGLACAGG
jgi:tetratricopeptide (TPR) repeat protein